nr:prepilin-type N-terminal cleavage/methylation domain-containing protein [Synergistaceae bacterium]
MKERKKNKGFTLVEIMVVVVIIGLLAALVM